jgi:hypothetical protein
VKAADDEFSQFIASVRKGGFLNAPGVPRERVSEWLDDETKRTLILSARASFLATLPPPIEALPSEPQPEREKPTDKNELLFKSKVMPNLERDIQSAKHGPARYRTEAMLAASNLPGWAKKIAKYAAADFKAFFIALGLAISSKRTLWDGTDERILQNYFSSGKFDRPLSAMTEEEASGLMGMTLAAYDKRLQRLGIRRKGGRPSQRKKPRHK